MYDGATEGSIVGSDEGMSDGTHDGANVGDKVGATLGNNVGADDGDCVGYLVGLDGAALGDDEVNNRMITLPLPVFPPLTFANTCRHDAPQ